MKRVLKTLLCVIALALSLNSFACKDESHEHDYENGICKVCGEFEKQIKVKEFSEIKDALQSNCEIIIEEDITSSEQLVIPEDKTFKLNLYGNVLEFTCERGVKVSEGAKLIISSSGGGELSASEVCIETDGNTIIENGKFTGEYAIFARSNSVTVIDGGEFRGYIYTNGTHEAIDLKITGGKFYSMLYLAAGDGSVYTISDGEFQADDNNAIIEIDAGTLNITGGTFLKNIDTSGNEQAIDNNNGSGTYKAVIVVCKPSGTSNTGYVGDAILNVTGGRIVNEIGDAIVLADHTTTSANGSKGIVNISGGTITGEVQFYDRTNGITSGSTINDNRE